MDYKKEFLSGFRCSPPEDLPEELCGRLHFLSCLAHKQSREIYLTEDEVTGGKVILKMTKPGSPDSVKREYELLLKLDHPSIPKVFLYGSDEKGQEYLLREYMPGDTLESLMEREGVFEEKRILELVQKLCGVLSYLHSQNPPVIYRDIKPQNIVLSGSGKVSIIDFGISREDREDRLYDTVITGSVPFAAPEMYGFTKSDSRTDIFTLGRLMLYLSTGITDHQKAEEKLESKELRRLIRKCTRLAPEKRFASVEKLAQAADRILNPPTGKEIAVFAGAAILCVAVLFGRMYRGLDPEQAYEALPVGSGGTGYEEEVKIPVRIRTLFDGKPFSDCAVAVDNHHWFAPAEGGEAQLQVFPLDEYKIRAVSGNRTAMTISDVTREEGPKEFTFDLAKVPRAPELLSLVLPCGKAEELKLEIEQAEEVLLANAPPDLRIEKRGGEFYLLLSETKEISGHHFFFAEAQNELGKADMALSLNIRQEKPPVLIDSAEGLGKIRENLSGHYALTADIDLSGAGSWIPIGSPEMPFSGELDGRGHTIRGLRITQEQSRGMPRGGLFGEVSSGVVRNLILRESRVETADVGHCAFGTLIGMNLNGLIENCAVFDSEVSANVGLESGIGGICGVNQGILRQCFNASKVRIFTEGSRSWTESCAGGICGVNNGYLSDSGNIGEVTGISLAGGVSGFNDGGILTRCYNAGYVKAPAYFSSYLAGGIAHLLGRGKISSYSAFEEGSAQVGSSVFNGGTLLGLVPVKKEVFRDMESLAEIFHLEEEELKMGYASADLYYPLPYGIFAESAEPPQFSVKGRKLYLDPPEGVRYIYTTDGGNPYQSGEEIRGKTEIELAEGMRLKAFSAQKGRMDSAIIEYVP